MPAKSHTHKLLKKQLGKQKDGSKYFVFACVLPDCTSTFRIDLVRGKKTICWGCSKEFIVTAFPSDIQVRPRCKECKLDKGFRRNKVIEEKDERIEQRIGEVIQKIEKIVKEPEKVVDEDIDWDTLLK